MLRKFVWFGHHFAVDEDSSRISGVPLSQRRAPPQHPNWTFINWRVQILTHSREKLQIRATSVSDQPPEKFQDRCPADRPGSREDRWAINLWWPNYPERKYHCGEPVQPLRLCAGFYLETVNNRKLLLLLGFLKDCNISCIRIN